MGLLRIVLLSVLMIMAAEAGAQQREHVVQRGEDFSSIAKKYGITEQELMEANPSSTACYTGRKLLIPKHGVPVVREKPTPKELDIELLSSNDDVLTKNTVTTYQVGQALWKKKKYDDAMSYLHVAADSGEVRAYYPLGDCYAQKDAAYSNEKTALHWYYKAVEEVKDKASENYWLACRSLASQYQKGEAVPKDLDKAEQFCLEYQRHGDPDSQADASRMMKEIRTEKKALAEQKARERRQEEMAKRKKAEEAVRQQQQFRQQQNQVAMASTENKTVARQSTATAESRQVSQTTTQTQRGRSLEPWTTKVGNFETTYYPQADGSTVTISKMPCVYCHGSRMCVGCCSVYGSITARYYSVCPMCGGTRQCLKCQGKGYVEQRGFFNASGEGYAIDSQGHMAVTGGSSGYSSSSSSYSSSTSSSSRSSYSSGTCPDCGGKGYRPQRYEYAAGSSIAAYHNTGGSCCYICGQYSDHYHYRCTTCKRG